MTAVFSLANLFLGAALAARAPHEPARTAIIETFAGIALIAGLSLLGWGLHAVH